MNTKLRSRLQRLEAQNRRARRSVIQIGRLKRLPDDFIGERHVVAVDRKATGTLNVGEYEFEERPGPEPPGRHDDAIRTYLSEEDMKL